MADKNKNYFDEKCHALPHSKKSSRSVGIEKNAAYIKHPDTPQTRGASKK